MTDRIQSKKPSDYLLSSHNPSSSSSRPGANYSSDPRIDKKRADLQAKSAGNVPLAKRQLSLAPQTPGKAKPSAENQHIERISPQKMERTLNSASGTAPSAPTSRASLFSLETPPLSGHKRKREDETSNANSSSSSSSSSASANSYDNAALPSSAKTAAAGQRTLQPAFNPSAPRSHTVPFTQAGIRPSAFNNRETPLLKSPLPTHHGKKVMNMSGDALDKFEKSLSTKTVHTWMPPSAEKQVDILKEHSDTILACAARLEFEGRHSDIVQIENGSVIVERRGNGNLSLDILDESNNRQRKFTTHPFDDNGHKRLILVPDQGDGFKSIDPRQSQKYLKEFRNNPTAAPSFDQFISQKEEEERQKKRLKVATPHNAASSSSSSSSSAAAPAAQFKSIANTPSLSPDPESMKASSPTGNTPSVEKMSLSSSSSSPAKIDDDDVEMTK